MRAQVPPAPDACGLSLPHHAGAVARAMHRGKTHA